MKNLINEIKNKMDGINSKLQEGEETIRDLKDRVMESNQNEQVRNKYCIRRTDMENSVTPIKHNNIHIIGIPKEERDEGTEKSI